MGHWCVFAHQSIEQCVSAHVHVPLYIPLKICRAGCQDKVTFDFETLNPNVAYAQQQHNLYLHKYDHFENSTYSLCMDYRASTAVYIRPIPMFALLCQANLSCFIAPPRAKPSCIDRVLPLNLYAFALPQNVTSHCLNKYLKMILSEQNLREENRRKQNTVIVSIVKSFRMQPYLLDPCGEVLNEQFAQVVQSLQLLGLREPKDNTNNDHPNTDTSTIHNLVFYMQRDEPHHSLLQTFQILPGLLSLFVQQPGERRVKARQFNTAHLIFNLLIQTDTRSTQNTTNSSLRTSKYLPIL